MNNNLHYNIIISDFVNKNKFIELLLSGNSIGELSVFNSLKGILFSDISIQKFIENEEQYDIYEAVPKELNRKLRSFSAGEQKKEFLKYCLHQDLDFIILDNPFDHLDQDSRIELANSLEQLSRSLGLIQLVNRREDTLSFIKNKFQIKEGTFGITTYQSPTIAGTNKEQISFIPKPLYAFETKDNVLIKMEGVSVNYNEKPIVNSIFWTIKQGQFWQLIGPNGAGKSTILSMITAENPKGYGQELYLFGRKKGSGESIWDVKKNIGIFSTSMTQLFKRNQSIEQMILSGFFDSIGLYTKSTELHKLIVSQWLEFIGMSQLKNSSFHKLSLGQQRVVLIVRAVIKHPPLIILDEPLEGLDDANSDLVIKIVNLLMKENKTTLIYVSHRIEPRLKPTSVFELIPKENGSIGVINAKSGYSYK